jgi:two-component system, NarL family, sensor histidine kinase UhpB
LFTFVHALAGAKVCMFEGSKSGDGRVATFTSALHGYIRSLLAGRAKLRAMAAHQERIKEEERARIAREIHDELGSQLTGIKSYLSYMADLSERAGVPRGVHLEQAMRLADDAMDTVRRVIAELRPSVLDELGLWDGLEWLASRTAQQSGLRCSTALSPALAETQLSDEQATAVFRIVQEALTNVARHAQASALAIVARPSGAQLVVEVIDDGVGISPSAEYRDGAWGLAGMRERARHFGGELTIEGRPGLGTRVVLSMPLGAGDAQP